MRFSALFCLLVSLATSHAQAASLDVDTILQQADQTITKMDADNAHYYPESGESPIHHESISSPLLVRDEDLIAAAQAIGMKGTVDVEIKARDASDRDFDMTFQNGTEKKTIELKFNDDMDRYAEGINYRIFFGEYAEKSITDNLFRGQFGLEKEPTSQAGVEIGKLVTKNVFGLPIDMYIDFAVTRYIEKGYQNDFYGLRLIPKFYYTFPWKDTLETRLIAGTGPSYDFKIPHDEREHLEEDNQNTSHYLNALFVGVDVNAGQLLGIESMKNCHLGVSDEHRSGAFHLINGIMGGSDYDAVYIECNM